jgi:hypothetical protein
MNAKQEFLRHTENRPVKAAIIRFGNKYADNITIHKLPINYSEKEYGEFLDSINKLYDDGFGGQKLFGYIWYVDGTWSERGEYDGAEWWAYKSYPEINFDEFNVEN